MDVKTQFPGDDSPLSSVSSVGDQLPGGVSASNSQRVNPLTGTLLYVMQPLPGHRLLRCGQRSRAAWSVVTGALIHLGLQSPPFLPTTQLCRKVQSGALLNGISISVNLPVSLLRGGRRLTTVWSGFRPLSAQHPTPPTHTHTHPLPPSPTPHPSLRFRLPLSLQTANNNNNGSYSSYCLSACEEQREGGRLVGEFLDFYVLSTAQGHLRTNHTSTATPSPTSSKRKSPKHM